MMLHISDGIDLHLREDGPRDGPAIFFANALGTTMQIWDAVIARLPHGVRCLRYDMRGHGGSSCAPAPYTIGALIRDAERVLEHVEARDVVVVGISIGGLVAQGLAAKRLDLVCAAVLSNTAPKIGTRALWEERVNALRSQGPAAMAQQTCARWFSRAFLENADLDPWRRMLEATPTEGYAGCAAAIAGTDFFTPTAALRLPVLAVAGDADGSTPPDLVREMAELIPGAKFTLLRGAGHVPSIDQPEAFAAALNGFLEEIGHLPPMRA